jgi:hypothetical protein
MQSFEWIINFAPSVPMDLLTGISIKNHQQAVRIIVHATIYPT